MKKILLLLFISILFMSCSKTYYVGRIPSFQFTYPNANVTPLNKVRGEAKKTMFLGTPFVTSSLQQQALQNALSKSSDGDILINVDVYQKQTNLMIVNTIKLIVEGTAAKQEIGKQEIGY
jgi:hypothetical protein